MDELKNPLYFSISGVKNYFGMDPFIIGSLFYCEKEPSNKYDVEAIQAILPIIGIVGYVANSYYTVVQGTYSAGRLYDKVPQGFFGRVMFHTDKQVICRVETDHPDLLAMELTSQMVHLPEFMKMPQLDVLSIIKK